MKQEKKRIFSVTQDAGTGRLELPDFLRGAAMLLVLLQHSGAPFGNWILAFHMPLLFLLSGYTTFLTDRQKPFWTFLKGRFLRLLVPYFLFEGLNLAVWCAELILQGSWQDLSEAAVAVLACLNTAGYTGYYGRLWFFPCMFVADVLFYGIRRACGGKKGALWCAAAGMLALSWITCRGLPYRLPFTLDSGCLAVVFLLVGYLLGDPIRRLLDSPNKYRDAFLVAVLIPVLWFSVTWGRAFCLMYVNQYGPYFWMMAAALSGSGIFLIGAKWLYAAVNRFGKGKNLILWYGRRSLATFPVHLSVKIAMLTLWPEVHWLWLLAAMLLLNIPTVNFFEEYLPFFTGRFPVRRHSKAG